MTRLSTLQLQDGGSPIRKTPLVPQPPCPKHGTCVLDGIQSSGERPGTGIRLLLLDHGDLVLVRYPLNGGFDTQQFIDDILKALQPYERVTFIGLSLGGLLAYDIIAEAKRRGVNTKFNLVLADTPPGKEWLQRRRGAEFMSRFTRLPCERLLRTLMFKQFRPAPPRFEPKPAPYVGELTEGQRAELAEHVRLSAEFPLRPWLGQLAYIVRHGAPQPEVFQGVQAVFIGSEHDEHVRPGAYGVWNKAYEAAHSVPLPFIRVDSPHVGLMERPNEWREVLKLAFAMLGIRPLSA